MRSIFAFIILVASAGIAKAQTGTYHFISNQQQQVKYDSVNKVYFIDGEINKASSISIEDNIISFVTADNKKSSIYINNMSLEPLADKVSFTLSGRDTRSGKHVKLGFWFIAGVLEEVSYSNESIGHSIAYKDIADMNEMSGESIAIVHRAKK